MGSTDPLTGARYPFGGDAATIAQYIQNAVNDLSDDTVPAFTSAAARDAAYSNWVASAAGRTMRDGLMCTVAGDLYAYKSGWKRQVDAARPRARLASANQPVPGNGTLFGIGQAPITTFSQANNGSSFFSQRADGLDVQPGIYAVTFNIKIVQPGGGAIVATSGRSLLDIVGNADNAILSRAPLTWPGEAAGTNSTTLFLPAAQQVRFLMYLQCNADPITVSANVDIVRLGDF